MSWTTGTQTETLGANSAVGTAYNTSTTITAVQPFTGTGYLPANFFLPSYGIGKSLLVKCSGVLSTTSTPNLTFAVTFDSAPGTMPANLNAGTAGVMATTGAVAQAATVTNVVWELDCVITCVTTGSSGTFLSDGTVKIYTSATAIQTMRLSSSAGNPNTSVTTSTLNAYYVELAALWGTSSSSNTLTVYSYIAMGLN